MVPVVSNREMVPDQFGDPGRRPELGPVSVRHRAFFQQIDQAPPLRFGQLGWPARRGLGSKARLPTGLTRIAPTHNAACAAADPARHLVQGQPLIDKSHRAPTPFLQSLR